jgi:hypothetical protein
VYAATLTRAVDASESLAARRDDGLRRRRIFHISLNKDRWSAEAAQLVRQSIPSRNGERPASTNPSHPRSKHQVVRRATASPSPCVPPLMIVTVNHVNNRTPACPFREVTA